MFHRGFTLIELLITVTILAILLSIGIPSFTRQIHQIRMEAAMEELFGAIQLARSTAVTRNQRVTLRNLGGWEAGWHAFADGNNNGVLDTDEDLVFRGSAMKSVSIHWNDKWAPDYVSFIGSGVGRRVGGALQMGTFRICPAGGAEGRALTLAASGRLRVSRLDDCN